MIAGLKKPSTNVTESRLWLLLIIFVIAVGQWRQNEITYGNREIGYQNQSLAKTQIKNQEIIIKLLQMGVTNGAH